jgi:regulator of sigma E protease
MGPKLYSRVSKKTGTVFSIMALPTGGFCAMEGEEESVSTDGSPRKKPIYARALVLAAGAVMNIILALVVIFGMFCYTGYDTNKMMIAQNVINSETGEETTEEYQGYAAGLRDGDRLIRYNGHKINNFLDLSLYTNEYSDNTEKDLIVKHADGTVDEYHFDKTKPIGIVTLYSEKSGNVFKIMGSAAVYMFSMVKAVFVSLFWLVTGKVGISAMAGPIGLTQMVDSVVTAQATFIPKLLTMLEFGALISVNLGIFNLLPFPGLDGGRLLILLVELIRKKPLDPEKEAVISFVGLALLMILALFVAGSDIFRIFKS